jgi:hypothetical protein
MAIAHDPSAAAGARHARRDASQLLACECWTRGVQTHRERLDQLEASNPDIRPEPA